MYLKKKKEEKSSRIPKMLRHYNMLNFSFRLLGFKMHLCEVKDVIQVNFSSLHVFATIAYLEECFKCMASLPLQSEVLHFKSWPCAVSDEKRNIF